MREFACKNERIRAIRTKIIVAGVTGPFCIGQPAENDAQPMWSVPVSAVSARRQRPVSLGGGRPQRPGLSAALSITRPCSLPASLRVRQGHSVTPPPPPNPILSSLRLSLSAVANPAHHDQANGRSSPLTRWMNPPCLHRYR